MKNKYLIKYEKQIYRLPIYAAWVVYIFKFKKFPYFMEYETFRSERIVRQIVFSIVGIKIIDILLNLNYLLKENDVEMNEPNKIGN